MSKLPFVLTLLISGTLLGWLHLASEPPAKAKPRARDKARPAAASPAPVVRAATRSLRYGYPDPRGILLELHERGGSCPASRFRSRSPVFVLWDDGNVVSMSPTFDYRRGRVSLAQADLWSREFQEVATGQGGFTCAALRGRADRGETISLRGRTEDSRELTLSGPQLARANSNHSAGCADCGSLEPLARLLDQFDQQRRHGGWNETLSGMPVEVHLEWRSCGCRNHPEIVNVSKEWPLPGEKPAELCARGTKRFRLEDPEQIRQLSEAIARSAAVLDRGEIYTCFMRPLLELPKESPLAQR